MRNHEPISVPLRPTRALVGEVHRHHFRCLFLLGWILSLRAVTKGQADQSLRLLLFIPTTNPFALLFLLIINRRSERNPILVYLLAVASLS
jgi:hypothetical protein